MSPAASASSSPAPVLAGFRSLLATNLALLGFQQRIADCAPHLDFLLVSSAASPSSPDPSPIDENMFAKPGSCVKAMEAVVYFLFQKLDSAAAQEVRLDEALARVWTRVGLKP